MKTRDLDLAELEKYRDQAPDTESRKQRTAVLEQVYDQSKDSILERLREQLIVALQNNDLPAIADIQKKVEAYASTTSFIKNQYQKMQRVSPKRAEIFIAKK